MPEANYQKPTYEQRQRQLAAQRAEVRRAIHFTENKLRKLKAELIHVENNIHVINLSQK